MEQQDKQNPVPVPASASIVGAWRVDAEGAPFVSHVMLFHADGTCLIHNPDAGNPHTSDSLGVGAWKVDGERPNTMIGAFEEVSADHATHQYVHRLRVTFTLRMEGATMFRGQASATYYAPDGTSLQERTHEATLIGTRILP